MVRLWRTLPTDSPVVGREARQSVVFSHSRDTLVSTRVYPIRRPHLTSGSPIRDHTRCEHGQHHHTCSGQQWFLSRGVSGSRGAPSTFWAPRPQGSPLCPPPQTHTNRRMFPGWFEPLSTLPDGELRSPRGAFRQPHNSQFPGRVPLTCHECGTDDPRWQTLSQGCARGSQETQACVA